MLMSVRACFHPSSSWSPVRAPLHVIHKLLGYLQGMLNAINVLSGFYSCFLLYMHFCIILELLSLVKAVKPVAIDGVTEEHM